MKNIRGSSSLVGLLVGVALLIGLTMFFVFRGYGLAGKGSERPDGQGKTLPGRAMARAKDTVCIENLRQVRMSIEMNTTTDDEKPETIEALKLPAEVVQCPNGKEPYVYDAQQGKVNCPHPGHEKY